MSTPEPHSRPLPPETLERAVGLLAALAHPTRLLVLTVLHREGPRSVGALVDAAGIEQSAMSHQLRVLRRARLVRTERRGRQIVYHLHDHHVARIVEDTLGHVVERDPPRPSADLGA